MRITVPCSTFLKRLLYSRCEVRDDAIIVTPNSILGVLLIGPGQKSGKKNGEAIRSLNDTCTLECPQEISPNIARIMYALDRMYRNELNRYIASHVAKKVQASEAIRLFCEQNNVAIDVDINYATLYRDYQRYQRTKKKQPHNAFFRAQKQSLVAHKKRDKVRKTTHHVGTNFSDSDLDRAIHRYTSDNAQLFVSSKKREKRKLKLIFGVYVYRAVGKRDIAHIAKRFALENTHPRTLQRKIQYYVKTAKALLLHAPPFNP